MIDTNRIRTDIPIDITQLCNTGLFKIDPADAEGGFLLQEDVCSFMNIFCTILFISIFQGLDCFNAEINLEVQWASEHIIAAVERAGSTITTAYYDPFSLEAAINPINFFARGISKPVTQSNFFYFLRSSAGNFCFRIPFP